MPQHHTPRSIQFILVFGLYQCVWHLFLPLVLLRLWWKGRKEPGYRQHILERFGFYSADDFLGAIWIHAVSVGETRAAGPLIEALILQGHRIVLTHMTPTGRATGAELFSNYVSAKQLIQRYVPYDFCWPVARFYRKYQPSLGLLMETEVWPSLLYFSLQHFPILLINGRLSLKSSLSFARFGALSREIFGMFTSILAQSEGDCDRYQQFGVTACVVTGNLKFDVPLDQEQIAFAQKIKAHMSERRVLCAASSREGEEQIILEAWLTIPHELRPLLILVPRHLKRVPEIMQLLQTAQVPFWRRSELLLPQSIKTPVLLGDTMGEMALYLEMSDCVVMGGSWQGTGGQNLIEPIVLGKPVIVGPSMYNFNQITRDAVASGIVTQVFGATERELKDQLARHLQRFAMGQDLQEMTLLSKAFASSHQGATLRTLQHLKITHK